MRPSLGVMGQREQTTTLRSGQPRPFPTANTLRVALEGRCEGVHSGTKEDSPPIGNRNRESLCRWEWPCAMNVSNPHSSLPGLRTHAVTFTGRVGSYKTPPIRCGLPAFQPKMQKHTTASCNYRAAIAPACTTLVVSCPCGNSDSFATNLLGAWLISDWTPESSSLPMD